MFIAVGDEVLWRGSYSKSVPKQAKVVAIAMCESEEHCDTKGDHIEQTKIFVADKNRCIFTLDNGHWAYGAQITK